LLQYGRRGSHQYVGEVDAGEKPYAFLQHFFSRLLARGRLEAVVLQHHLHRHPAELAAFLVDGQLERVALVFADIPGGRRQGGDEADAYRLGGRRGLRQAQAYRAQARQSDLAKHDSPSREKSGPKLTLAPEESSSQIVSKNSHRRMSICSQIDLQDEEMRRGHAGLSDRTMESSGTMSPGGLEAEPGLYARFPPSQQGKAIRMDPLISTAARALSSGAPLDAL